MIPLLIALAALLTLAIAVALSPAAGHGPKRWRFEGPSNIRFEYFQGVTSDSAGHFYFDGVFTGLYRTDARLREQARNPKVSPDSVTRIEGYDHIGDITWEACSTGTLRRCALGGGRPPSGTATAR